MFAREKLHLNTFPSFFTWIPFCDSCNTYIHIMIIYTYLPKSVLGNGKSRKRQKISFFNSIPHQCISLGNRFYSAAF